MDTYNTVRYHDGECYLAALVRQGRVHLHFTYISATGVRHATAPLKDARYLTPLTRKGSAYPVERMVRKLRTAATALGITDSAKAELARAAA
jgi:hypothetical protein